MNRKALLALSAVFLSACAGTRIGRINADPSRYANQMVTVSGRVTNSVGILGTGGYQLEDETGRIYVISRSGVPSRGSTVKVTGTVTPGVTVLGQPVGVAIREDHHRVR
jgi:hypothetical protein